MSSRRLGSALPSLSGAESPFVVYVEGARDGEILRGWAQKQSPQLARALADALVILGGRRPERARSHLDALRESDARTRGLCVLDRDGGAVQVDARDGLEGFSWERRHIESYLLVPTAIRRSQRLDGGHAELLDRLLEEHLASSRRVSWESFDAKRLLGPKGPFARAFGRTLSTGRIARAMTVPELHPDAQGLLERLGAELGFSLSGPEVFVRQRR